MKLGKTAVAILDLLWPNQFHEPIFYNPTLFFYVLNKDNSVRDKSPKQSMNISKPSGDPIFYYRFPWHRFLSSITYKTSVKGKFTYRQICYSGEFLGFN